MWRTLWKLWNVRESTPAGAVENVDFCGKHPDFAYCDRLSIAEIPCAATDLGDFHRVGWQIERCL